MGMVQPTWLSIVKPNKEPHETLVKRRLVLLEKATPIVRPQPLKTLDEVTASYIWKEWPADTPAVVYDAEGDVVKYLPTPTGTTFEIELDQTFTSAATPTGKWWYGNFTTTSGFNHVFTAEQEGQLDDNNSFTFLYNEHNGTILIGMNNFVGVSGSFGLKYEDGSTATGFDINSKSYGDSNSKSLYYVITLPEPNVPTDDKVKITFNKF
jgi:hypothetical protein